MEKTVCDPLFWCHDDGMLTLLIWGYNLGNNCLLWLVSWNFCFGKWTVYKLANIKYWAEIRSTLNWAHSKMGCKADVTHHITCHVSTTFHVIAMSAAMSLTTSIYMSSLLSTSSPSQQSRHPSCHQCVTWQFNLWRKLYCSWSLFLSQKTGLGWASGGPETLYDSFKTS